MDNYVIQDLLDFCDKILFEVLRGKYKYKIIFYSL